MAGIKWTQEEVDYIRKFYKDHTAREIGEALGRTRAAVALRASQLGLRKQNWMPNGVRSVTAQGYHRYGQQYIQRIVWEEAHGPVPPKHEIHHVDGDKLNNELSNLRCISLSEHRRIHSENWKKENGQWLRRCTGCHKWKMETEYCRQWPSGSIRCYCKVCANIRRGAYRDKCRLKGLLQSKA